MVNSIRRPRLFQQPIWALAVIGVAFVLSQTIAVQGQTNVTTNGGTIGTIPKWTAGTALGDSVITELSSNAGINVVNGIYTSGSLGGFIAQPRSGSGALQIWYNPYGTDIRLFSTSAGAGDLVTIQNSGNVGIGTTGPGAKLDISAGSTQTVLNLNGTTNPEIRLQNGGFTKMEIGIPTGANNYITGSAANDAIFRQTGGGKILFSTSSGGSTNDLTLSGGNVGIGTTSPQYTLDVTGSINASGTISGGNVIAKYQDLAEWVPASRAIPAASVVVLDAEQSNHVLPSSRAYDTRVAGVVSAKPGVILGEGGAGKVMVATTGRVRVKVDATVAPIRVGDLLVTSDKEGVAMRSQPLDLGGTPIHRPGTLIGKALEPLEKGVGEILVLLSLQ